MDIIQQNKHISNGMNYKKAFLYGFGIWVFTLVVSVLTYPLHENQRPLFESIMPVALVFATSFLTVKYFKDVGGEYAQVGLRLAVVFFLVNLILDAIAFSSGPMKMGLADYIKDIGLTYLILLIIPISFGKLQNPRP